jgi:serine/threonine-protein kinase
MTTRAHEPEEPEPPDRVGEIVAGRYRLDALLGRGGMGCVYRAQHLELDEPVVVKFIDPAYATHPTARARFRREAKALMRLRHPGVVTMHEFGEDAGGLFLVMELLEGRTLGTLFGKPSDPVPLATVYDLFLALGGVLEAAHAAGVFHRDIKPDNVMLVPTHSASKGPAERAILMDFGLANFEEAKDVKVSTTGTVVGTPAYMSPEQCMGHAAGPASDIYALGTMLFEALAGRHPFGMDTAAVMMSQHMFVAPPKLASLASGEPVPPGLAKLVEDMLAKKPESRPTAADLLRRLEETRTGVDAHAFAADASARRLTDAMLTREERGLPTARPAGLGTEPTMMAPSSRLGQPLVWLRGFPSERASRLVATLAVNGLVGICGETLAALGPPKEQGEPQVVVLPGGAGDRAPEVVRELRQLPGCASLPVLVIEVPGAVELAELIRAGASDAALAMLGDDVLAGKIWRLVRRKR